MSKNLEIMLKIYGIKNCDTVKKALQWFSAHHIAYTFVDFKKKPVEKERVLDWMSKKSWKELVNTRGTTYRALSEDQKKNMTDETTALQIILEKNCIIKRPIIEYNNQLIVGFDEALYTAIFKS